MVKGVSPLRLFSRTSPKKPTQDVAVDAAQQAKYASASATVLPGTVGRAPLSSIPEAVFNPLAVDAGSLDSSPSARKTDPSTPRERKRQSALGQGTGSYPHLENPEGTPASGTPEKHVLASSATSAASQGSKSKFTWQRQHPSNALEAACAAVNLRRSPSASRAVQDSANGEVPNTDIATPSRAAPRQVNFVDAQLSGSNQNAGTGSHNPLVTPRRPIARQNSDPDNGIGSTSSSNQPTPAKSVSRALKYAISSSGAPATGRSLVTQNATRTPSFLQSAKSGPVSNNFTEQHFELEDDPMFWKDHNVQVLIRCRPLSSSEIAAQGYARCLRQESSHMITWLGQPESKFTFDHVACEGITQEKLFRVAGLPMVDNCISGYNSCMFAYGQTGSGKTHTMLGDIDDLDRRPSNNRGMTPRVFEYLFARIRHEEEVRRHEHLKYTCKCSFLEIYNEQITDLLEPTSSNLQMREDAKKGVYVENLTEVEVLGVHDVIQLLLQGSANRKVAATNMNRESSRSHSVFTCVVESKWECDAMMNTRFGRLNLVDLAGSERQKSSGAEGERLKEAVNINKSLSTLGLVIMVLVDIANGKQRHVPYRDSKLTFLLQDSLGGNSKTTIIANVSPSSCCGLETLSTLKFAQRAKFIRNNAVVNEDASGDVIALRQQIQQLKDELNRLRRQSISRTPSLQASLVLRESAQGLDGASMAIIGFNSGDVTRRSTDSWDSSRMRPTSSKKMRHVEAVLAGALRREQDAENVGKRLAAEIEQLHRLVRQREEDTQCSKMMLRFREDKIRRLELLTDGVLSADECIAEEKNALQEELQLVRGRIDRNPELTRFAMENIRLMEDVRRYQEFYEAGEREILLEEVASLRDQLLELLDGKLLDEQAAAVVVASSQKEARAPELESAVRENELLKSEVDNYRRQVEEYRNNLNSCLDSNSKMARQIDLMEFKIVELGNEQQTQLEELRSKQSEGGSVQVLEEQLLEKENMIQKLDESLKQAEQQVQAQIQLREKEVNLRQQLADDLKQAEQQVQHQIQLREKETELRQQVDDQLKDAVQEVEGLRQRLENSAFSAQATVKRMRIETEKIGVQQRESLSNIQEAASMWRQKEVALKAQLEEAQSVIRMLTEDGSGEVKTEVQDDVTTSCEAKDAHQSSPELSSDGELINVRAQLMEAECTTRTLSSKLKEEKHLEVPSADVSTMHNRAADESSADRMQRVQALEMRHSEEIMQLQLEVESYEAMLEDEQQQRKEFEKRCAELCQEVEGLTEKLKEEKGLMEALEGQQVFTIRELEESILALQKREQEKKLLVAQVQHLQYELRKTSEVRMLEAEFQSKAAEEQKKGSSDGAWKSALEVKLKQARKELEEACALNVQLLGERDVRLAREQDMDITCAQAETETARTITTLHSEVLELKERLAAAGAKESSAEQTVVQLGKELEELTLRFTTLEQEKIECCQEYERLLKEKVQENEGRQREWETATTMLADYLLEGDQAILEATVEMDAIIGENLSQRFSFDHNFVRSSFRADRGRPLEFMQKKLQTAQNLVRETEAKVRALSMTLLETHESEKLDKERLQEEVLALHEAADDMSTKYARLQAETLELECKWREAEKKANAAFICLASHREIFSEAETSLKNKVELLTDAIAGAEKESAGKDMKLKELQQGSLNDLEEVRKAVSEQAEKLGLLEAEVGQAKETARKADALEIRAAGMEVELHAAKQDLRDKESSLIEAKTTWITRVELLRLELEDAHMLAAAKTQESEELEAKVGELESEAARLSKELKESQERSDSAARAWTMGQDILSQQVIQANAEVKKHITEASAAKDKLVAAEGEILQLTSVLAAAEKRGTQLEQDRERLSKDVEEARAALLQCREEAEILEGKVATLEAELEILRKSNADSQEQAHATWNVEKQALTAEVKRGEERCSVLEEELERLTSLLLETRAKADDGRRQQASLAAQESTSLATESYKLKSRIAALESEVADFQLRLQREEEKTRALEKKSNRDKDQLLLDLQDARLAAKEKAMEAAVMSNKLNATQSTLKELERTMNALVRANETSKSAVQTWRAESLKLSLSQEDYEQEMRNAEGKVNAALTAARSLRSSAEREALLANITAKQDGTLGSEPDAVKELVGAAQGDARWTSKLELLLQDLREAQDDARESGIKADLLQVNATLLGDELALVKSALAEKEALLAETKAQLSEQLDRVCVKLEEAKSLAEVKRSAVEQLESRVHELEREIVNLTQRITESEAAAGEEKEKAASLSGEISTLQAEAEVARTSLQTAEAVSCEKERKWEAERGSLSLQLQQREEDVCRVKQESADLIEIIAGLQAEVEMAKALSAEADEAHGRALKTWEADKEYLLSKLQVAQSAEDSLAEMETELQRLRSLLKETEERLGETVEEGRKDKARLVQDVEDTRALASQKEAENDGFKAKIIEYDADMAKLHAILVAAKESNEQRISEWAEERESACLELEKAKREVQKTGSELQEVMAELDSLKSSAAARECGHKEALETWMVEKQSLTAQVDGLRCAGEEQANIWAAKVQSLEKELETLRMSIAWSENGFDQERISWEDEKRTLTARLNEAHWKHEQSVVALQQDVDRLTAMVMEREDKLSQAHEEWRKHKDELLLQVVGARDLVSQKESEQCELKTLVATQESALASLQASLLEREESSRRLERDLSEQKDQLLTDLHWARLQATEHGAEAAALATKYEDNQCALKEVELTMNALVCANESLKSEAANLRADKEKLILLRDECAKLEAKLVRSEEVKKGLEFDISLLQESAAQLTVRKEEAERAESVIEQLENELEAKVEEIREMDATITKLEATLFEKDHALNGLSEELLEARSSLNSRAEEATGLMAEVRELRSGSFKLEAELAEKSKLSESLALDLSKALHLAAMTAAEVDALKSQLEDILSQKEAVEDDLEDKQQAIAALEIALVDARSFEEETVRNLTKDLNLVMKERDRLLAQLVVLTEQLEMAQAVADEQQSLASEARQVAEASKTHAEERETEARLLERSVEELESTINALESQVGIVKREGERQRLLREDLEMELQSLKHHMTMLQANTADKNAVKVKDLRDARALKDELERNLEEKEMLLLQARNEGDKLRSELEEKTLQIQRYESMLEQSKSLSLQSSSSKSSDKSLVKTKGSGSPFKCGGKGLVQQIHSDIDEELYANRQRIEELEGIAAARQKEVFMLHTRLAEAESMTHDVVRDLLGVKLDITNYASLLNQEKIQQIAESARKRTDEAQEKDRELASVRAQLSEFIEERESWLEEINRRQAEMVAARVAAEKLRLRDQTLSAENERLQAENGAHRKRLFELEGEVKKLSGQQNLQQRIHHHAKIKEENNQLRVQNEDLNGRLRRTEVVLARVSEELARYRSAEGKKPFLNIDEEQRLRNQLKEEEDNRIQIAQKLISLCTSVMQAAGVGAPPTEVDSASAMKALRQLEERLQSAEREVSDMRLTTRIAGEKRRLSELRAAHSPYRTNFAASIQVSSPRER